MRKTIEFSMLLSGLLFAGTAVAGPFAPAAGQPGSTAIHMDDPSIVSWATGYQDYRPGPGVAAAWQTPEKALGKAVGDSYDIVTLGDKGTITLTFDGYLYNGDGYDFAIFENSFSDTFLELAFVEVSSNGTDFFRFDSYSFTPSLVGGFGSVDPTNIDGLAGKYRQGWGTPFDLELLAGFDGLDINHVQYVRLVDIKGDGSEFDNWPAEYGGPHPIYDPFPTSGSPGFDLDAVGVMHLSPVPEPETYAMLLAGLGLIGFVSRRRQNA
ncbi:MAG: PEP-CTERM sorting domain-containing protein [Azoarcus sp.]|nr:PEP-CTERM sorting domain-containing protein [Azoarcus sp.]